MRRQYFVFFTVLVLCAVGLSWSPGEARRDSTIVATVNGEAIKYADVKVSPDADILLMHFRLRHSRDPVSGTDREEIERERQEREVANVMGRIRALVRREQIKRFGIEPTEQEIDERWRHWQREREREGEVVDPDVMGPQTKAFLRELLQAMKEVIDEGKDAEDVYRRRLAGTMSLEQWRLRLQYEGTPERRKTLERALALPNSEFFKPQKAFRNVLVRERLGQAIERELVGNDPEFAEYMKLAATNPRHEKVQSKGRMYREAKIYEWWQQRYREASIEIKDPRFRDVLEQLGRRP